MRGAGYVNDPSEGWQVIVTKANEILDNFVHPHIPGLVDAAVEIWPWLLAGWVAATIVFVLFLLGVYSSTPDAPRWVITRDLKVQDHCVVTDDGAILRGISKGSGPSILLLHGAGCSSDIFTFLFKRFSLRGYRVYAFDLRGHGVSNDVAHLSAKVLAADLHAVLKDLDLTLTTIIGHGLGGYAALAFALYYPSSAATRIGRLVLLSSFAKMPDEMHSTTGKAVRMLVGAGMLHLSLRWRSAARYLMRPFFGRGVTETLQEEWRRAVLSCPRKVWKQGLNAGTEDVSEGLKIIQCPVHILCGTRDNFCSSAQEAMCRTRPDLEVTYLPNVGHISPWEAPDSVFNFVYNHVEPAPLPETQLLSAREATAAKRILAPRRAGIGLAVEARGPANSDNSRLYNASKQR